LAGQRCRSLGCKQNAGTKGKWWWSFVVFSPSFFGQFY
jgi:hypothetical protein